MPPSPAPLNDNVNEKPITDSHHLLAPHKKSVGPLIGIIIILVLLIVGAFYFWGARLNKEASLQNQAPYIPAGTTTLPDVTQ